MMSTRYTSFISSVLRTRFLIRYHIRLVLTHFLQPLYSLAYSFTTLFFNNRRLSSQK